MEVPERRRVGAGILAVLLLSSVVAPGIVSAQEAVPEDRSAFVVEVAPDGDARVSLALTYELNGGTDEAAFDRIDENAENVTAQFTDRLSGVATRTESETGREMTISNVSVDLTTNDGVGIVTLSASWSNLAAVQGDRLVVAEPFASGFQPDRPFVLVAPDGHTIVETTVPADSTERTTAEWSADTDLSGFSATLGPDDGAAGGATGSSLPTPLVSLLAAGLVALLGYAGWRRV